MVASTRCLLSLVDGERLAHERSRIVAVLVEQGEVEVELAREVLVEHGLGDPGPLGDVVHRGGVVARTRRRPPGPPRAAGRGARTAAAAAARGRRGDRVLVMRVLARRCVRAASYGRVRRGRGGRVASYAVGNRRAMASPPLVAPGARRSPREERTRYARHLLLPDVGLRRAAPARERPGCSSSAPVGSAPRPCSTSPRPGVGTIGVVDDDVVDASNLQRQVVHGVADVGRPKTESAAEAVARVNPLVDGRAPRPAARRGQRPRRRSPATTSSLDGTDNFPTRYLVNDACVLLGKPHVWGSIYRFDGQVSVWWAGPRPVLPLRLPRAAAAGCRCRRCADGWRARACCARRSGRCRSTETIKLVDRDRASRWSGGCSSTTRCARRWDTLPSRRTRTARSAATTPTSTELVDYEAFCGRSVASRGRAGARRGGLRARSRRSQLTPAGGPRRGDERLRARRRPRPG